MGAGRAVRFAQLRGGEMKMRCEGPGHGRIYGAAVDYYVVAVVDDRVYLPGAATRTARGSVVRQCDERLCEFEREPHRGPR